MANLINPNLKSFFTSTPTFAEFVDTQATLLWHGDHLKRSVQKAKIFSGFDEYGGRQLKSFKPDCIHAFFDHLAAKGLNGNTINHYAAMLTKVFKQAVRNTHIMTAPQFTWREVRGNQRPLYYTNTQLAAMESHFDEYHPAWWLRHFIIIGAETGVRLGEILTLKPAAITSGDDGSTWAHLTKTKNGDERFVPLNIRVQMALAALDNEPMRHHRGNEHLFYRCWAEMRTKVLQGDKRYVFHTLRHTAATVMANDFHANTAIIGMLLGHKCEKTTAKYIKTKPEALQALVARFGQKPFGNTLEEKGASQ